MNQPRTGTISDEMDRRKQEDDPLAQVADRVAKSVGWFGRLLPPVDQGGIAPEAFAAQLLNLIRRNRQPAFRAALVNDPDSFFYAATDCAALNLKPGEEYWFVPFNDKAQGTGQHFTGMPGWKGELQQIYRSGSVRSVKWFVVYQGDHFRWKPTEMEVPEYEPLAEDHDPANLRRVVAYAEFHGGGISQVVHFTRYEVMRAKAKSKAPKDFWESEWEPEQWLKTALHRLYDYVPHSAAYNTQLLKAWATAMEQYPAIQLGGGDHDDEPGRLDPGEARQLAAPAPPAMPGTNGGNGHPAGQQRPGVVAGAVEPPDGENESGWEAIGAQPGQPEAAEPPPGGTEGEDDPTEKRQLLGKLGRRFQQAGWTGDDYADRRLVMAGVLAVGNAKVPPLNLSGPGQLTVRQAKIALATWDALAKAADEAGEPLAGRMQRLYDAAKAEPQGAAVHPATATAGDEAGR